MSFLHIAFLGGALAVAVPIVLHLIMRPRPKRLEFPALRFVKLRHTANRRQMRFRHWLLLALRCAIIALLALALARPSILASGMLGDEEAPLAAALVFDTNPRMQYREHNQTRLEAAQETAQWLLPQFPAESDVAVVDSRSSAPAFAVDRGAARQRIARLDAKTMSQPLALAIESALKLVQENDKPRKEVYIMTDLTRDAWGPEATRDLTRQLEKLSGVGLYVIDVGALHPSNFGLADLHLSGEVLSRNSPLRLEVDVVRAGPAAERGVELYVLDRSGLKANVRGQSAESIAADASQRATFQLRGLEPGLHQGYLKLVGEDALACDDTRWFTVEVRPAWRVLIAAPSDGSRLPADYALFLAEALAPQSIRIKGEAAFEYEVISLDELAKRDLDGFAAVCLVDPHPIAPAVWQKLHGYVSAGGGLGIFLGRNATPIESFNEPAAQELMPGKLLRQWRTDARLAPADFSHPVLAKFRPLQNSIAWESLSVFRHWQLTDLADGAGIILAFSNGQPALVERPVGSGRMVLMTTPVSDPANRPDVWNLLPTGDEPWPFVMLANELLRYLVGSGQQQLNYSAGQAAAVHLGTTESFPGYVLTTPGGDQIRTPVDEAHHSIVVTSTEMPGNYRLRAGGGEQGADWGFSVNLPPSVSQLERVTPDELKAVFASAPFRLARERAEIDRSVSAGRAGQELFPYLMLLLILVLACEQAMGNRFYQDYDTARKRSRVAQLASRFAARRREPRKASVVP
jgi:hypothetical protein